METRTLILEVPEYLVKLLGSPEEVAAKAKEALVLALLREVKISQGRAAILLGITRWDILDLMVAHQIPAGPATVEEFDEETERMNRWLKAHGKHTEGGDGDGKQ